jgi:hypothetical protein
VLHGAGDAEFGIRESAIQIEDDQVIGVSGVGHVVALKIAQSSTEVIPAGSERDKGGMDSD